MEKKAAAAGASAAVGAGSVNGVTSEQMDAVRREFRMEIAAAAIAAAKEKATAAAAAAAAAADSKDLEALRKQVDWLAKAQSLPPNPAAARSPADRKELEALRRYSTEKLAALEKQLAALTKVGWFKLKGL